LFCNNNNISDLNVTGLDKLKILSVMNNPLSTIDLSDNTLLEVLNARNSSLRTLDVSENPNVYGIDIFNAGPINANDFSACALDSLFLSLPDRSSKTTGVLKVIYGINNPLGNNVDGSNKTIANNKNWRVASYLNETLTGDGNECANLSGGLRITSKENSTLIELMSFEQTPDGVTINVAEPIFVKITDIHGRIIISEEIKCSKFVPLQKGVYILNDKRILIK